MQQIQNKTGQKSRKKFTAEQWKNGMIFLNSDFRSEEIEMTEPEGGDDDDNGTVLNGYRILT